MLPKIDGFNVCKKLRKSLERDNTAIIEQEKEIIEKYNLYYDSNFKTEDAELWSRALKYVKATNLDEVLLKYRSCEENETQIAVIEVLKSDIEITDKQLQENLNVLKLRKCLVK